jgi:hypothetical protein
MCKPHDHRSEGASDSSGANSDALLQRVDGSEAAPSVMVTVKLEPHEATIESVAKKLEIRPDAIDRDFGVVLIDPTRDQYAVLVEPAVARSLSQSSRIEGIFSNPRIQPFDT